MIIKVLAGIGGLAILLSIAFIIDRLFNFKTEHEMLKRNSNYLMKQSDNTPDFEWVNRNIRAAKEDLQTRIDILEKCLQDHLSSTQWVPAPPPMNPYDPNIIYTTTTSGLEMKGNNND